MYDRHDTRPDWHDHRDRHDHHDRHDRRDHRSSRSPERPFKKRRVYDENYHPSYAQYQDNPPVLKNRFNPSIVESPYPPIVQHMCDPDVAIGGVLDAVPELPDNKIIYRREYPFRVPSGPLDDDHGPNSMPPSWIVGFQVRRIGLLREVWDSWKAYVAERIPPPHRKPCPADRIVVDAGILESGYTPAADEFVRLVSEVAGMGRKFMHKYEPGPMRSMTREMDIVRNGAMSEVWAEYLDVYRRTNGFPEKARYSYRPDDQREREHDYERLERERDPRREHEADTGRDSRRDLWMNARQEASSHRRARDEPEDEVPGALPYDDSRDVAFDASALLDDVELALWEKRRTTPQGRHLGQLGTTLVASPHPPTEWHLDATVRNSYSAIMVFGDPLAHWNSSEGQGNVVFPQLGLEVEVRVGDVLFFQGDRQAHYFRPLDPAEQGKWVVCRVLSLPRFKGGEGCLA